MATLSALSKELHERKKQRYTWHAPRAATTPLPTPETKPKNPLPPPKGKGGELWLKLKKGAEESGYPNPDAFADAALRAREKSLELAEKVHKVTFVPDYKPKGGETAAAKPPSKLAADVKICRAKTLEGRPCRFKATCGDFCKKHAPK